jgi:phage FluMu gp28-like protein
MFYVGLDLGQKRDYTAIAVVERRGAKLMVRHLERVTLGTSYPRVVERVRELVQSEALKGRCVVAMDGTGVGVAVLDMMRAAALGCEVSAVTITSGTRESSNSVPKRHLMTGMAGALARGELRITRQMREVGVLVQELMDVRITARRRAGSVRIGADGNGQHDDLVVALALACWRAGKRD